MGLTAQSEPGRPGEQSARSTGGNGCRAGSGTAGDAPGADERNPARFEAGRFGDPGGEAVERWTGPPQRWRFRPGVRRTVIHGLNTRGGRTTGSREQPQAASRGEEFRGCLSEQARRSRAVIVSAALICGAASEQRCWRSRTPRARAR